MVSDRMETSYINHLAAVLLAFAAGLTNCVLYSLLKYNLNVFSIASSFFTIFLFYWYGLLGFLLRPPATHYRRWNRQYPRLQTLSNELVTASSERDNTPILEEKAKLSAELSTDQQKSEFTNKRENNRNRSLEKAQEETYFNPVTDNKSIHQTTATDIGRAFTPHVSEGTSPKTPNKDDSADRRLQSIVEAVSRPITSDIVTANKKISPKQRKDVHPTTEIPSPKQPPDNPQAVKIPPPKEFPEVPQSSKIPPPQAPKVLSPKRIVGPPILLPPKKADPRRVSKILSTPPSLKKQGAVSSNAGPSSPSVATALIKSSVEDRSHRSSVSSRKELSSSQSADASSKSSQDSFTNSSTGSSTKKKKKKKRKLSHPRRPSKKRLPTTSQPSSSVSAKEKTARSNTVSMSSASTAESPIVTMTAKAESSQTNTERRRRKKDQDVSVRISVSAERVAPERKRR